MINNMINRCSSEEYDLLEKLIHVPQNKLNRYASKVCSYRDVNKDNRKDVYQIKVEEEELED